VQCILYFVLLLPSSFFLLPFYFFLISHFLFPSYDSNFSSRSM